MRAGIALYLALASADRLLEATVREAAMSSPEWWEAHHQLAKLKPGTSWFGPIGRAIALDIAGEPVECARPATQWYWVAAFRRRLIGWRVPARSDASTGLIAQFRQ